MSETTVIEQQASGRKEGEIRYLTPLNIETSSAKKYCRFKRSGINMSITKTLIFF